MSAAGAGWDLVAAFGRQPFFALKRILAGLKIYDF